MGKAQYAKLAFVSLIVGLLSSCGKRETASQEVPSPETSALESSTARDLSGIWWSKEGTPVLKPLEASSIPLTPAGRSRYEITAAAVKTPPSGPADVARCAPFGVPRIWTQPYPFQILQKPEFTAIAYEHNNMFRIIYMNEPAPNPEEVDPRYRGNSVGRWEGDTLIVETVGFTVNDRTVLDDTGLPYGDKLKVTERIRKIRDGEVLEVTVTIEDPDMFTGPWTSQMQFERHPEAKIEEYICGYGQFETRYTRAGQTSGG